MRAAGLTKHREGGPARQLEAGPHHLLVCSQSRFSISRQFSTTRETEQREGESGPQSSTSGCAQESHHQQPTDVPLTTSGTGKRGPGSFRNSPRGDRPTPPSCWRDARTSPRGCERRKEVCCVETPLPGCLPSEKCSQAQNGPWGPELPCRCHACGNRALSNTLHSDIVILRGHRAGGSQLLLGPEELGSWAGDWTGKQRLEGTDKALLLH